MNRQMKAMVFHGAGDMRYESLQVPEYGSKEALVRVQAVLTCGTDVKMYRRGHPLAKPPMIMGHEFAGVLESVGEGVSDLAVGMRVVALNSAPCNECFFCQKGSLTLCERLNDRLLGFSLNGAYAEYVTIPEHIARQNVLELPADVSFDEAALVEPLACVVHGAELVNVRSGEFVVVLGAGPIGLMHLQVARHAGASKAVVVDKSVDRLAVAERLGADWVVGDGSVARVKELTAGYGADVVIEAVGLKETWETAVAMTRKGGRTLFFGGCPSGTQVTLDAGRIHYGEMMLTGSFHHTPATVRKALKLIADRTVNARALITKDMRLEEVPQALELMAQGKAMKIAIHP